MSRGAWQCGIVALASLLLAIFGGASASAATVRVAAVNFAFKPATTTVHIGDTVTWAMSSVTGDPHTVTSGTSAGSADGKFTSGLIYPGGHYSHKFTTAGTYPYFCQIHPEQMKGTVTVVAASPTPGPTPRPTPGPTPRPTPRPTARPTPRPTQPPTPRLTAVPTAPTPAPNPTEALPTSSTSSQSPEPVAAVSPGSIASLAAQALATPSSAASDTTPASDRLPLVAVGILVAIGILGAIAVRARRIG